jgi:MSHA biogenesis protein MshI
MPRLFKKKIRQDTVAAICPGSEGVALAEVRRDKDVPPLLDVCRYLPREPGQSEKSLLNNLAGEYHLDSCPCVSLVELGEYSLLMVEAPEVQPDEIHAAIRWRIKDLIDFHIDDAVVDVFEVPDTKAPGINRMLYAVVARSSAVKKRVDALLDADVNLDAIDIPELALRNIASLLPEDAGGVALLYISDYRGLITITRQSTLYLSRRIEKGLSILPDTVMHAEDPDIIEPWMDSIIVEIQRSLDYYESHFSQPQVASIVITPLAREIPGIAEYITEQLEIPTRILDVNLLIDTKEPVENVLQSECLLAIGAALRQENRTT